MLEVEDSHCTSRGAALVVARGVGRNLKGHCRDDPGGVWFLPHPGQRRKGEGGNVEVGYGTADQS